MRDQLPVMPVFRLKSSGRVFDTLQEAALVAKNLTLDNSYILYWINDPQHIRKNYRVLADQLQAGLPLCRATMFNEIEVISNNVTPNILKLFNGVPKEKTTSLLDIGRLLAGALFSYIESVWDSSKIKIIPHSSGYDSRMISWILKVLSEKNGSNWLGDVYFICCQPEIPQFHKLMDYMRWHKDTRISVAATAPQINYFAEAVTFENVGRYCSDANRISAFARGYLIEKEIEKLGSCVEVISGLWSDEVLKKSIWGDLSYLTARCLHDIHYEWGKYDPILPFCASGFLELHNDNITGHSPDVIKKAIIDSLDPHLFNFENARFEYFKVLNATGTHPIYILFNETKYTMQQSYNKSWYAAATNISIKIPPSLHNKHTEWKDYTKAAICEWLISKGCSLGVK